MTKKTTEMSRQEKSALQSKLDAMLTKAIADVSSLGFEIFEIEPTVRLTNNRTRLGSAQVINGAKLIKQRRRANAPEKWEGTPRFRISISSAECGSDEDINNVLYHEVIHCIAGCCNHGTRFKAVADKVNRAFGTKVETSKKAPSKATASTGKQYRHDEIVSMLGEHIGETFSIRRKTYTLVGFNNRPKNCVVIEDARKVQYVTSPMAVASALGLI